MSTPFSQSPADNRIRIAFCITELDPGGAERALWQIVKHLDTSRFQPLVISLQSGGEIAERLREMDVEVKELGVMSATGFLRSIKQVKLILREFAPQIVQGFLFHGNIVSRLAARGTSVSAVVSGVRVAERRSRGYLWLDRVTSRWVDEYICVSQAVAQYTIQVGRIPAEKVSVIPNGIDPLPDSEDAWSRNDLGIEEGQKVLLFVGRLDRQKGIDQLIEAMPTLSGSEHDCHLVCIGIGELEATLKASAGQLGLSNRIHFLGYKQGLKSLYQMADLLVLPSRWEGMPNVVLEALSCGLPVAVTAVEGIQEIQEKTDGIFTIPDVSAVTISRSVQNALEAVERRRRDAGSSQVISFQWDTWRDVAAQYEACYEKLLSRRQA